MIVTAWKGGTYGLKLTPEDRDQYFKPNWDHVLIYLGDDTEPVEVNTRKASFWNDTCRELISTRIGVWLHVQGYAPWPKGKPPKLTLEPLGGNQFRLT